MEAAWLATARLSVRGLARPGDQRRGRAGTHRLAPYPAGLEGRLDLAAARREAAGNGGRPRGAPAVPLPPGIPRAPGAGEIRQARALCRAPSGASEGAERASRPGAA